MSDAKRHADVLDATSFLLRRSQQLAEQGRLRSSARRVDTERELELAQYRCCEAAKAFQHGATKETGRELRQAVERLTASEALWDDAHEDDAP